MGYCLAMMLIDTLCLDGGDRQPYHKYMIGSSASMYKEKIMPGPQYVSLVGNKYNKLTVVSLDKAAEEGGRLRRYYNCVCDCDPTKAVSKRGDLLVSGNTKSCGCLIVEVGAEQLTEHFTGQRCGKLLVISRAEKPEHLTGRAVFWDCLCDCGKTRVVRAPDFKAKRFSACKQCVSEERKAK